MALVLSTKTVVGERSCVMLEPYEPIQEPAAVVAFIAHTAVEQKVTGVISSIKSLRKDFQFVWK
jgi:hypothetical protein